MFWIQTGSEPNALKDVILDNNISNNKKNKQLDKLIQFCAKRTREIIKTIEPHFLIILGSPARKSLRGWDAPKNISRHFAKHPDRSSELSEVLTKIKPGLETLAE